MTLRFAAGPDTYPASEARKLPFNLISRSLPRFLIFLFSFFFFFSFMSSYICDRLFNRILCLFLASHSCSLLSTQIYYNSALVGNI